MLCRSKKVTSIVKQVKCSEEKTKNKKKGKQVSLALTSKHKCCNLTKKHPENIDFTAVF